MLALLGTLFVAGGAGAALTVAIGRLFADKWLTNKFARELERFRHEQQTELEHIRYRINSYFDRSVRLHQVEFDVIPKLWAKLHEAYSLTRSFSFPLKSYPDLNRMNAEHLDEFLERSPLMGWERAEILRQSNKTNAYIDHIFWHDLHKCKKACVEFNNYLERKCVFLDSDLDIKFRATGKLLWSALVEIEVFKHESTERDKREERTRLESDGPILMNQIKAIVQKTFLEAKTGL